MGEGRRISKLSAKADFLREMRGRQRPETVEKVQDAWLQATQGGAPARREDFLRFLEHHRDGLNEAEIDALISWEDWQSVEECAC